MNFQIPYLTKEYMYIEIDFIVAARDMYSAISSELVSFNVSNNYVSDQVTRINKLKDFYKMLNQSSNLNDSILARDTYYQLQVSNFFEVVLDEPKTTLYGGNLCLTNQHCFENGICDIESSGKQSCICNAGYTGIFC